jgi:hypothetical protein
MYGPPPSCKRKGKIAVWSAQMYPVFDGAEARDLDGMRFTLVLASFTASKGFSVLQVSRVPGWTILPSLCSPADLVRYLESEFGQEAIASAEPASSVGR